MNIKYLLIGIILFLLLINGTIGEETATAIQTNQTNQKIQPNETQKTGEQETEEPTLEQPTLEQLIQNRDWNKVAEIMNNGEIQGTASSSMESSIKPVGSDERWDNWFAPKVEEEFIIIPCGG